MKTKLLAIILCLAMLFSVVLPMGVSAEETEIPDGTIAITEICATPDDDRFEFVEVMNASEVEINLNNYTVARFGFDHGGNWAASGLGQMMGWAGNLQDLNALPLTQDVALKKNEVALIWFVTQANASLTVEDFNAYWESKGNDMSKVTVVKVVHSAPASNIYNYCGDNFLPDQKNGFVISMIKTAKCVGTVGSYTWEDLKTTNTSGIATDETAKVHQLADCIALQYNTSTADTVNSRNYYGFVDLEKYNAAATPTVDGKNITRKTPLASALTGNADPLITTYVNNGNSDGYTYVEDGEKELPTPGALRDGQFGVSTDLGVYAAQYRTDGDTQSVRFVGYVEGTDYTEVGFWINATYTEGSNKVTKSLKVLATQTVYENITAGGETVGVSEATDEKYSDGYLMAIAVSGLPLENTTNITFYVTPYGITADGRTVVGAQVTHTLQNSAS